ncbi:MAG: hypothetical protein WBM28_13190 [Burkholderiales bacterium]
MGWKDKRIYISNFSGLGNRLEALVLAGLIEDRFGHSIYLDWPEKDSLEVSGTHPGALMPWRRPWSTKVRDFGLPELEQMGRHSTIVLRATYGPRDLQQRQLMPTAARLRPSPAIRQAIVQTMESRRSRPAVGVHIRHGDFRLFDDGNYDVKRGRHPAVPMWWYSHVMDLFVRRFPDVYFVLGYAGEAESIDPLRKKFDIVALPLTKTYRPLLPGHASSGHPVIDLFALACCSVLVASPTSTFSHWAANILGPEATCIIPPPVTSRVNPALSRVHLGKRVLLDWRDAAEQGYGATPVLSDGDLPEPAPAATNWL